MLLLCFLGVELFTRRNCHYPWMSVQSWFDLVRFDSSDDVFFGHHRRRKLAFVHVLDMMLFFSFIPFHYFRWCKSCVCAVRGLSSLPLCVFEFCSVIVGAFGFF